MKVFKFLPWATAFVVIATGCSDPQIEYAVSAETIAEIEINSFPKNLDSDCREGRAKLYDECSDQLVLFSEAKTQAEEEGKTLLVSFGAEWCIWCHVFDAYIHGYVDSFTYTYGEAGNDERYTHTMRERAKIDVSKDAYDLKKYVSENFVVVHIDYEHAPNGDEVMDNANAWDEFDNFIPYIFTVDGNGKFAATFSHDDVEVRRDTMDWYRGYDRGRLLDELKEMHVAAVNRGLQLE